jgi:hypothetical protein
MHMDWLSVLHSLVSSDKDLGDRAPVPAGNQDEEKLSVMDAVEWMGDTKPALIRGAHQVLLHGPLPFHAHDQRVGGRGR